MILWHTDSDKIERGQWVKHRVHEHQCELSPDGKLIVYGTYDGRRSNKYEKWVAVSRPPYFTALALWPVTGPGSAMGVFESRRTLVLYGMIGDIKKEFGKIPLTIFKNKPLVPDSTVSADKTGWFGAVEIVRIHRDQWKYVPQSDGWCRTPKVGKWRLYWKRIVRLDEAISHHVSVLHDTYAIECGEERQPLEGADWADIDQRGRLVYTKHGRLFAGNVTLKGMQETELADFSADRPEAIAPPASARHWP